MPKHSNKGNSIKPSIELDLEMMRRAIRLARRGEGRVEPNPMVGCIIAKRGRIISEGWHRRFGGAHAEVDALRRCSESTRGATVYVSLEPCSHFGKTPPCTQELIRAKVSRVVVAVRDPNPQVKGGGMKQLTRAGIKVTVGICHEESTRLLAPYLTHVQLCRPYVIAKWAQSLDGKLATASGDSQWISNEKSRQFVHKLRARMDAILVGSGTALRDDPLLTARNTTLKRQAKRIVLDARLRINHRSRLVASVRDQDVLVFTSKDSFLSRKADRLRRQGVEVVACRTARSRLSIRDVLKKLADRKITYLLVEGGPTLFTSFFTAGYVDEAVVFTAPRILGGDGAPSVVRESLGAKVKACPEGNLESVRRFGDDLCQRLRFTSPADLLS